MLSKVLKAVLKVVTVVVPLIDEVVSLFKKEDDNFSMREDEDIKDA